jgi:hypothetical protein
LTATAPTPTLHVPDEPVVLADGWLAAVLEGADLGLVLSAPRGLTDWLWQRWSFVATAGMSRDDFGDIVLGYRRELWFWLAGERTWAQACSGLVGRVTRRIGQADAPSA